MKNRKALSSLYTLLMILPLVACSNNTCSSESSSSSQQIEEYASEVTKFVENDKVETYMFMPGMPGNRMKMSELTGTESYSTVKLINDSTIMYESVSEYVEGYLNSKEEYGFVPFTVTKPGNKKIVIENDKTLGQCIIDFVSGDITYTDHSAFFTTNPDAYGIGDYIASSLDKQLFVGNTKYRHIRGNSNVTFNLKDYNIKGYWYEDDGYLPVDILGFALSLTNPLIIMGQYFNGKDMYTITSSSDPEYRVFLDTIMEEDTTINDEFMQYNYDCLAFMLDTQYGMKRRLLRTKGEYKDYMVGGAYTILEPYKERLLSKEENVFDRAISELFAKELDDGGHTHSGFTSLFKEDVTVKYNDGEERLSTLNAITSASSYRDIVGLSPKTVIGQEEVSQCYTEIDDTAFLTFDEFSVPTLLEYSKEKYYENTIYLVKYANEMIKEHNIANVVIDLTCNGGGAVLAEEFIESWLCGGSFHSKEYDTIDNSYTEVSKHADVDGDGQLSENDYLSDDIGIFCIISPGSFSCGNMLPSRLKEYSSCKFIGDRSGGGCCTVTSNIYLPIGGTMMFSSCHNSLSKEATQDNPITIDDGVVADFYKIPFSEENISKYFDRTAIVDKIHQK